MLNFFRNPETKRIDWYWTASVLVLAVYSGFTYLYQLAAGQRSEFYASIAVSMSKSLGNWWWGASDPGGTITLDKIPGSYWIPAIFVKLFGFSTWSVDAPNALAGIALVILVASIGRRLAGTGAGIIAGAVIATTPILAAVNRSNQPETYFLLALAIAAHFAVKALQDNSFKNLMLSGGFIALAFHCYMMVAWAMWPVLGIAWLLTNQPWVRKLYTLLAAGLTSLALSLVWIISVSLTPASARPYIGGSNTNSAWEMVFGYNGLGRFSTFSSGTSAASTVRGFTPPFSGSPSVLRLLNDNLLGQIGWLVPAAVVALLFVVFRKNLRPDGWFVVGFFAIYAVMFSVVSGMHQFYTAQLGIGMALLLAYAFGLAQQGGSKFGLVSIIAASLFTVVYITITLNSSGHLVWAVVVQAALAIATVVVVLLASARLAAVTPVLLSLALTFTPAMWAADVYKYPSSINPTAGPSAQMDGFGPGGFGGNFGGGPGAGGAGGFGQSSTDTSLVRYVTSHRQGAKYLMAVFGTMTAAPYITATGENVLPIGGFDGSDPAPSLKQFKNLVKTGQLRFVQLSDGGGFGGGPGGGFGGNSTSSGTSLGQANTNAIQAWVAHTCAPSGYSAGGLFLCEASSVK